MNTRIGEVTHLPVQIQKRNTVHVIGLPAEMVFGGIGARFGPDVFVHRHIQHGVRHAEIQHIVRLLGSG